MRGSDVDVDGWSVCVSTHRPPRKSSKHHAQQDKYQLLYEWKRPPLLDSTLARRARNFLVVGVAVHVVMARVFYAVRFVAQ